MVTHWKTEPVMDNPLTRPTTQSLQRPQVFVKVEFGVSWSAQHSPRTHAYEYKSRALREKSPTFPRHLPTLHSNYLAAASIQQYQSNAPPQQFYLHHTYQEPSSYRRRERDSIPPEQNAAQQNLLQPETPPPQRNRPRQVNFATENQSWLIPTTQGRRQSRSTARSDSPNRHERGHSAPPPLSENTWEVARPRASAHISAGSSTVCGTLQRPVSDLWKELPEVPSRFRLGEEDMPWDGTWAFPMGWEPFLEPDPLLCAHSTSSSKPQSTNSQEGPQFRANQPLNNAPSMVGLESPDDDEPPFRQDDPEQRRDLEALGSAMMTVDNGFENQWWNQGERQPMPLALHPPPTTTEQQEEQMALGWVGALLPSGSDHHRFSLTSPGPTSVSRGNSINPSLNNIVVSPVSSYSGPVRNLSRSLSTRSDELWFSSPRYA